MANTSGRKKLKNACWKGYEAYGFKQKRGRRVPNCLPKKSEGKKH